MSSNNLLEKVKQLREITGVGFKDCKNAIDENNGDIEKSIEFLRKKGIAKASKKMSRVAAEGLVCIFQDKKNYSMIEVNSETDFVAKNNEFINFVEEVSQLASNNLGEFEKILSSKMKNGKNVKDSLVDLISKIGEKITFRRSTYFNSDNVVNFSYIHSAVKDNLGKLGVLLSLETSNLNDEMLDFGKKLSMHIAATNPLAIDKEDLDKKIIEKENEIITEELLNSGKDKAIIDKIAAGKLNKFISDNTLLNQEWIIDPKKKVKDILKEHQKNSKLSVKKFIRYKVGEGV